MPFFIRREERDRRWPPIPPSNDDQCSHDRAMPLSLELDLESFILVGSALLSMALLIVCIKRFCLNRSALTQEHAQFQSNTFGLHHPTERSTFINPNTHRSNNPSYGAIFINDNTLGANFRS